MGEIVTLRPKELGANVARIEEIAEGERASVEICFEPIDPTPFWKCNCGEEVFYVTPDGIICPTCGCYSDGPLER